MTSVVSNQQRIERAAESLKELALMLPNGDDRVAEIGGLLFDLQVAAESQPAPATVTPDQRSHGVALIADERRRQVEREGWTPEHDDQHDGDELLIAALHYIDSGCAFDFGLTLPEWPWEASSWKPTDPVRDLVKAGALIAAEIDRMSREDSGTGRWARCLAADRNQLPSGLREDPAVPGTVNAPHATELSSTAHREARLSAIVQEMRQISRLADECGTCVIGTYAVEKWADQLAALLVDEDAT